MIWRWIENQAIAAAIGALFLLVAAAVAAFVEKVAPELRERRRDPGQRLIEIIISLHELGYPTGRVYYNGWGHPTAIAALAPGRTSADTVGRLRRIPRHVLREAVRFGEDGILRRAELGARIRRGQPARRERIAFALFGIGFGLIVGSFVVASPSPWGRGLVVIVTLSALGGLVGYRKAVSILPPWPFWHSEV